MGRLRLPAAWAASPVRGVWQLTAESALAAVALTPTVAFQPAPRGFQPAPRGLGQWRSSGRGPEHGRA